MCVYECLAISVFPKHAEQDGGVDAGKHGRAAFQSVKIILHRSYLHAGDRVHGSLPWLFPHSSCTRSTARPPVFFVHAGRY